VLVVTGFVPMIFLGKSITGWWLMVHATAAPVFAACIAVLAVLWADKNRLDKNYWPRLNYILHRQPKSTIPPERYELKLRTCFWIVLSLSLPVILTAVLSMFKLFGTDGQELLLQLHRYSTLLLSLFAIVYLYLAALTEMNRTSAK
jgi:cytochrome b subunit of formate dehydrogenase